MTLKYQTGVATIAQFIIMAVLNFINGAVSSVQQCTGYSNDCVSNIILSLLFWMLVTLWFGFLLVMGAAAQERRSRRVARILIAAEGLVALVALFDAHHYPNILGLVTSLVDAALAIWVITLAFRLVRARGGRVRTTTSRPRRRSTSK